MSLCPIHSLPFSFICIFSSCTTPSLCPKCFLLHPTEHSKTLFQNSQVFSDGKLIFAETLLAPLKNKYTEFLEKARTRKKEENDNLKENVEKLKIAVMNSINKYYQSQSSSLESEYSTLISEIEYKLDYISSLETTQNFEFNEEEKNESIGTENNNFKKEKKPSTIPLNSNVFSFEETEQNKMNINDPSLRSRNLDRNEIKNEFPSFSSCIHNTNLSIHLYQPAIVQKIRSMYDQIEGNKRLFEKEIRYLSDFVGTRRKQVPKDRYKKIAQNIRNILKCHMLVIGGREGGEKGMKKERLREIKAEEIGIHNDWVNTVVRLDSEDKVATGSSDCSIKIWNIQTFQCLRILFGHSSSVLSLAFFPVEKTLLSGSKDGSIKIWDYLKGVLIKTFDVWPEGIRSLLVLSRKREGMKEEGGKDVEWRRKAGETSWMDLGGKKRKEAGRKREKKEEEGRRREVWMQKDQDEDEYEKEGEIIEEEEEDAWVVVGGGNEGAVRVWNFDGKVLNKMDCHREAINCMIAIEGKEEFLTGSNDGLIKHFTFSTSFLRQTSSFFVSSPVKSLCPVDQRQFLSGSKDGLVKLWNILTGVCQRNFDLNGSSVNSLMMVNDEKGKADVLGVNFEGTLFLLNLSDGLFEKLNQEKISYLQCMVYANDGKTFVSGGGDNKVRIWKVGEDEEEKESDEMEGREVKLKERERNGNELNEKKGSKQFTSSNKNLSIFKPKTSIPTNVLPKPQMIFSPPPPSSFSPLFSPPLLLPSSTILRPPSSSSLKRCSRPLLSNIIFPPSSTRTASLWAHSPSSFPSPVPCVHPIGSSLSTLPQTPKRQCNSLIMGSDSSLLFLDERKNSSIMEGIINSAQLIDEKQSKKKIFIRRVRRKKKEEVRGGEGEGKEKEGQVEEEGREKSGKHEIKEGEKVKREQIEGGREKEKGGGGKEDREENEGEGEGEDEGKNKKREGWNNFLKEKEMIEKEHEVEEKEEKYEKKEISSKGFKIKVRTKRNYEKINEQIILQARFEKENVEEEDNFYEMFETLKFLK